MKKITLSLVLVFYSCAMPYAKSKINNFYNGIKEEIENRKPNGDKNDDKKDDKNGEEPVTSSIKLNNFTIEGCEACNIIFENGETIIVELPLIYFNELTASINPSNTNPITITPNISFEPKNAIMVPANLIEQTLVSEPELNNAVCMEYTCPSSLGKEEEEIAKNKIKNNIETKELTYTITDPQTKETKTYKIIFKVVDTSKIININLVENKFNMIKVEANLTLPKHRSESITIEHEYSIGETEITCGLWLEVLKWAIQNGYSFIKEGTCGSISGETQSQPVVNISYYDAIVWTNALTEYYNIRSTTEVTLTFVYTKDGEPIKDANKIEAYRFNINATGFRIPDFDEWEVAARYLGNTMPLEDIQYDYIERTISNNKTYYWLPEYNMYGSIFYSEDNLKKLAWFDKERTKEVKSDLEPNTLGLYDMLGNVQEFCNKKEFTPSGVIRPIDQYYFKGGSFVNKVEDLQLQIGHLITNKEIIFNNYTGFRIASTNK